MEDKVTILIPTYNRHRQLTRLLDYYSKNNFPILIADSTASKFPVKNLPKNIRYFHYPNLPYAKKLPKIYKKVRTKYVVFCADDDFISPSGIKESVKFLEKNSDYNSAHGHYVFFKEKNNQTQAFPFYLYSIDIDINSSLPSQRLKQLLSNYMQLLYAVTKTSDVKRAFKYLEEFPDIKNDGLVELLQASILCINGKSKVLPIFYCAREVTPNSARTHVPSLEVLYTKPQYKKEYNAWINVITNSLAKKEKISNFKAKQLVIEALNSYLKGLLITIPIINLRIYTLELQKFILKTTFGLAKKSKDLITSSKDNKILSNHAFMNPSGKKEFKIIQGYIRKHKL